MKRETPQTQAPPSNDAPHRLESLVALDDLIEAGAVCDPANPDDPNCAVPAANVPRGAEGERAQA